MDPKDKAKIVNRMEKLLAPFMVGGASDERVQPEPFAVGRQVRGWGLGRPTIHHVQTMHPDFTEQDITLFYQGYDYREE